VSPTSEQPAEQGSPVRFGYFVVQVKAESRDGTSSVSGVVHHSWGRSRSPSTWFNRDPRLAAPGRRHRAVRAPCRRNGVGTSCSTGVWEGTASTFRDPLYRILEWVGNRVE